MIHADSVRLDSGYRARGRAPSLLELSLFAIPTLAAFGPLLSLTGPVYPFRALVFGAFLIMLLAPHKDPLGGDARSKSKSFLSFLAAVGFTWVAWALVAGLLQEGGFFASAFLSEVTGLILVFVAVRVDRGPSAALWLRRGYVLALLVTGVFAVREVQTGRHLSNYVISDQVIRDYDLNLVASTFGNPNAYAVFLALGIPIIMSFFFTGGRLVRWGATLLVLATLALLLASGSRSSLGAAIVMLLVCVLYLGRRSLLFVSLTLIVYVGLAGSGILGKLMGFLPDKIVTFQISDLVVGDGSTVSSGSVRAALIEASFDSVFSTVGLGVGPGNFAVWMRSNGPIDRLGGTFSPHNAATELLVENGVVVSLLVLAVACVVAAGAWRTRRSDDVRVRSSSMLCVALLCGAPLYGVSSSTFWSSPTNWVAIAIFVVCGLQCARARSDLEDASSREATR